MKKAKGGSTWQHQILKRIRIWMNSSLYILISNFFNYPNDFSTMWWLMQASVDFPYLRVFRRNIFEGTFSKEIKCRYLSNTSRASQPQKEREREKRREDALLLFHSSIRDLRSSRIDAWKSDVLRWRHSPQKRNISHTEKDDMNHYDSNAELKCCSHYVKFKCNWMKIFQVFSVWERTYYVLEYLKINSSSNSSSNSTLHE